MFPLSPLSPLFLVSCSTVVDVASRSGMDMSVYCQALLELSELPTKPAAPALPDAPLPGPAFPRHRGDCQLELLARELDSAAEECVRAPAMEQRQTFLIRFKNTHMRFNVKCICFLLSYYSYAQKQFGSNVAAAFYILNLKGGFRLAGQSDWVRPNAKGKFSLDFINFSDLSIEEVDASGTVINYMGLNNLVSQQKLRCLSLRGCPEVDDWFLSRLHIFKDSLEELDLSGCSRVSVGGLSALHHLRKLRKLDLSSLPRVQNPGLVRILLEEVLPHCHIMGVEYQEGLQSSGAETDIKATSGL
uniref:Distal membrane-arm assembly complex protein 2 n=1 Tax=Paramormyrops kingsleyae TaxID=1676925 RepID=A0A3B3S5S2_9TELE